MKLRYERAAAKNRCWCCRDVFLHVLLLLLTLVMLLVLLMFLLL